MIKLCPHCNKEVKRRKKEACPFCGTFIESYEGVWLEFGEDTPPIQILKKSDEIYSKQLSIAYKKVVNVTTPKKGDNWRSSVATAKQLWELADKNLSLALECMDILATHKNFSWKSKSDIKTFFKDWYIGLAIAKANRQERTEKQRREDAYYRFLMDDGEEI